MPSNATDATLDGYANATGFTSGIMKDLQRIFACLEVEKQDGQLPDREYLVKLANAGSKGTFSNKITLAMSSQSSWRLVPRAP